MSPTLGRADTLADQYSDWIKMAHHGDDEPTFVSNPEEMKAAVLQRHVRQQMEQQAWQDELRDFLSEMSNERLVTLRKIMLLCADDTRIYLMGMVTGVLQFERKVCPDCGEDHSTLAADLQVPADLSGLVPPREDAPRMEVTPPREGVSASVVEEIPPQGIQGELFTEADIQVCCCSTNTPDTRCYRCKVGNHETCSDSGAFPKPRPDLVQAVDEVAPTRSEQLRAALGLAAEDIANMDKYWLDDAWSEDGKKFLGYVCTGTGPTKGPCGSKYPSIADRMLKAPDDCGGCNLRGRWG